jgi:hypothetical protein
MDAMPPIALGSGALGTEALGSGALGLPELGLPAVALPWLGVAGVLLVLGGVLLARRWSVRANPPLQPTAQEDTA